MLERYRTHVIDQALTVVKAHEGVTCLFITPSFLEPLCDRINLRRAGFTGVFCTGAGITPEFHRYAVEELLDGVYFAPAYSGTFMGLAAHKPRAPGEGWALAYYPASPRAAIDVVEPARPDRVVEYGDTGRVRITTLTKECFLPGLLEDDLAEREPPCAQYPWDGVRNVRPFSGR
jgi:hypothetical protein